MTPNVPAAPTQTMATRWLPSWRLIRTQGLPAALFQSRLAGWGGLLVALAAIAGFAVFGRSRDFAMRLAENRLFWSGRDPLDYIAGCVARCPDGVLRSDSGQMPWSYPIGLLFAPPVHPIASATWFLIVNVLAIASLAYWQARSRPGLRGTARLTSGFWVCTLFPLALVLFWGNYAVLVTALLLTAMYLLRPGDALSPGLLIGLASIKPHLALPFYLVLLLGKRWKALAAACLVPLALSAVFGAHTGRSPVAAAKTLNDRAGLTFETFNPHVHFGFLDPLRRLFGWEPTVISLLSAGCAMALLLAALLFLRTGRGLDLLPASAVTSVAAAVWSYHQRYDFVVLIIFCVVATHYGLRQRLRSWHAWTFSLACITLLVPTSNAVWYRFGSIYYILFCALWLAATVALCDVVRRGERGQRGAGSVVPRSSA